MATVQNAGALDGHVPGTPETIYPEETLGPGRNLVAAAQHVISMFGATVLGPLLMGFNPNTAIFFSGVATIIFFGFLRNRVPSYLGSSFSFIAAVNAATGFSTFGGSSAPNMSIALGGIVVAGAAYFFIGLIVDRVGHQWLERLMPPVVTGAIVAVIGINLAPVAVREVSATPFDMLFGMLTLALVIVCAVFTSGFMARIPILVGGGFTYLAYFFACNVEHMGEGIDFSPVARAPWFGFPPLMLPSFDATAIVLIAPISIVLVAENFGHVRAIAAMTGRNLDPYLGRAFMADGFATMLSGSLGGTGVTTYAENIGLMSLTRNFSTFTLFIAGIFAICLGLSPKFGAAIRTIPNPILGGLSFILFGLIAATAGRIWSDGRVDFTQSRNLLVAGVALVMGAGDLTWRFGNLAFAGIATATFSTLVLYHVIANARAPVAPLMRG